MLTPCPFPTVPRPQCENESALNLYETCKVRTVKAGTLEKLVEHLVPAFQGSDLSYVTVFLCTYRAFTTTQQVLDLLFKRCTPTSRGGRAGGGTHQFLSGARKALHPSEPQFALGT